MDKIPPRPVPKRSDKLPAGPLAAEEWAKMCRLAGFEPLSKEEAEQLPPWTEEEAIAFAKSIEEISGQPSSDASQSQALPSPTLGRTIVHTEMSTANPPPTGKLSAALRGSHTVGEALDAYWRSKGMEPPNREKLADLPPWPKEDADAFERVINEMFERVDKDEYPL